MKFSAPIPGANFTTDTRNYSWHRPPDITDFDEGVEYLIRKMDDPDQSDLIFSLIEMKTPITVIVSTLMLQAISRGKIPIDLGILMSGPIARYIEILAKAEGLSYEMGSDDKDRLSITPTALKVALGVIDSEDELPAEEVSAMTEGQPEGGLMAMPDETTAAPAEEQEAMLGMAVDDEPVEVTEEETVDGLA